MEKRTEIIDIVEKQVARDQATKTEKTEKKGLKNDFDVFLTIYELTELKHQKVTFSVLTEEIDADKIEISKNLDKLYDLCMVTSTWDKDPKDGWKVCFSIEENSMYLAKSLFEAKSAKERYKKIPTEKFL